MNLQILARRHRLIKQLDTAILLFSGDRLSRNFRANQYLFRASSHFLYFAGLPLAGAMLFLEGDRQILFIDFPTADDALWHGEFTPREELRASLQVDRILPKSELKKYAMGTATIPLVDPFQRLAQSEILGRELSAPNQLAGCDQQLAKAIVNCRLTHDSAAIAQIQSAIDLSVQAHIKGMQTAVRAKTEAEVRGAIEGKILAGQMTFAYNSIVTTHGEILHNEHSFRPLNQGDLLLVDAGAETTDGWASDITRTYPISGKFSSTQRDLYDIVLAAHDQAIAALKPGVEYSEIHWLAAKTLTEGLLNLGIFKGQVDDLLAQDVHALFFPHGIGHLLGLDVHDMEDFGDLAGYAKGRSRGDRFGECFLRLNRPLKTNMIVTIEPGFYQIPSLLNSAKKQDKYQQWVNWDRLADFTDVRGIRIEDDILITANGSKNLSKTLSSDAKAIENIMNS
ncbi:MAG: aminopeptidase P family protein [Limnothrix sp.]